MHKLMSVAALALVPALLVGTPVFAADMAMKAPPPAPPQPAASWTGFYVGGEIGGAWANRSVTYTANDPAANILTSGAFGLPGEQPLAPNSFNMAGVSGGFEAGYNWQVDRAWLLGIETDFSGSSLTGTGNGTSIFTTALGGVTNNITEKQSVDWYGTVRGRLGWLPSDSLLLFATGGFAYGRVANSGNYSDNGASLTSIGTVIPFSFSCTTNSTCFAGASSSIRTGWTLGGGIEWLAWRNWSLKAEYQYVNLGIDALRLTALATSAAPPGLTPASFNANVRDDFHVVRAGVNYHF